MLVLGLVIMLIVRLGAQSGECLIVKHNREVICEIPLEEDGEYPLLGGKNVIVVSDGEVYMKSADCPHKKCIGQGKKSRSGEWIYCLPNKLSITVK